MRLTSGKRRFHLHALVAENDLPSKQRGFGRGRGFRCQSVLVRKTTCHRNCGNVDEVWDFDARAFWLRKTTCHRNGRCPARSSNGVQPAYEADFPRSGRADSPTPGRRSSAFCSQRGGYGAGEEVCFPPSAATTTRPRLHQRWRCQCWSDRAQATAHSSNSIPLRMLASTGSTFSRSRSASSSPISP